MPKLGFQVLLLECVSIALVTALGCYFITLAIERRSTVAPAATETVEGY